MIAYHQYVPILKGKRGEFTALSKLPQTILEMATPVIDVVIPPINKSLTQHIKATTEYIKKYWDNRKLLYIDGYMIQDLGLLDDRSHPMDYIFNNLLSEGFNVLPVIGTSTGNEYNEVIKNIISAINSGACLRIFRTPSVGINSEINRLLNFLELSPQNIDLIFDLRSLEGLSVDEISNWVINHFNRLSYLSQWRSLILSGGNFPINLSEIAPDQIYPLPRNEWHVWQRVAQIGNFDRVPSYSDYAISHPSILEYDSEVINMSASIRYTGDDYFYIYRGRGTRQYGFEQFYDLSEMLITRTEFCGREHCFGDNFIYLCGIEKRKKGNPETWRRVGTNHHITKVTDQLRQFFLDFNI